MTTSEEDSIDREIQFSEIGDPAKWRAWLEQQTRKAGERIRAATAELVAKGIIDAEGRLLSDEVPPDMRPGSRSDVET